MNTDFYLTIITKNTTVTAGRNLAPSGGPPLYAMAIYRNDTHPVLLFTSYHSSSKADMIVVGKAYAKQLNIVYKECEVDSDCL